MIIFIFSSIIIIAFFINDAIPMYINKEWTQFWVYITMMSVIMLLMVIKQLLNMPLPSPAEPIKDFLIAIFGEKGS